MDELDSIDQRLLGMLQRALPVNARPFDTLGETCGISGADALERVRRLKSVRIIRQISAIFDTKSLGYASSLVAARIAPADLQDAVKVLNSHPGVSHNYARNHEFNIWYTLAVPPDSTLGLPGTVELLHQLSRAESTRMLPTVSLYKIGVRFDMEGDGKADAASEDFYSARNRTAARPLTGLEREFVRLMQEDLPLEASPFQEIAGKLGISLEALAALHEDFLATGRMRRFAAVLHHRKAGFRANAMGVWNARTEDDAEIDRLGGIMAGFQAVSHCYRRPTYPDWPYALFTMVHGRTTDDCEATLDAIAAKTGLPDRMALYSSEEFKKVRVRYFTGAESEWESRHQALRTRMH